MATNESLYRKGPTEITGGPPDYSLMESLLEHIVFEVLVVFKPKELVATLRSFVSGVSVSVFVLVGSVVVNALAIGFCIVIHLAIFGVLFGHIRWLFLPEKNVV